MPVDSLELLLLREIAGTANATSSFQGAALFLLGKTQGQTSKVGCAEERSASFNCENFKTGGTRPARRLTFVSRQK